MVEFGFHSIISQIKKNQDSYKVLMSQHSSQHDVHTC